MMKRIALALSSGLATFVLIGSAYGQQDEAPNIVIIEIYGCTYNANNDMSDFVAVTDRWNDWADERGVTDYTANILTPYLYSDAFPYDLVWLGVYPSGEAMGAGQAQWLSEGGELNAEFGEVVDCSIHAQFAATAMHVPATPPEPSDDDVGLISFQDCTLQNERGAQEALAAHGRWGDYLAANGSDLFMGALFPIAGEDPEADYNYKAVTGFSSANTYGQFIDTVVPGGLQTAGNIFGGITVCDTSRVYVTTSVRETAGDD